MARPVFHQGLVVAQLGGVALAVLPVSGLAQSGWPWLVVAALGIAFGVLTLCFNRIGNFSIYPTPRPTAALITDGPYRWVRHPMYVALALMMVGIAGYNGGIRNLVGAAIVIVVVIAKSVIEERLMGERFAEYAAYRARTRRFIPFLF